MDDRNFLDFKTIQSAYVESRTKREDLLADHTIAVTFSNILLTVTGFLVGLALSFRSSTAYERYNDGRKYWAQLAVTSQSLARIIWTHAKEREGEQGKEDLLAKM